MLLTTIHVEVLCSANLQFCTLSLGDISFVTSSTIPRGPAPSSTVARPPCLVFEDPDNNQEAVYQFRKGAKIIIAATSSGPPLACPWMMIPPRSTGSHNTKASDTYHDLSISPA